MRAAPRRTGGFSLVELMVSITIGLLLVGAMLATLTTSAALGRTNERAADVRTNGTYALALMKRDVQHAGFLGLTSVFDTSRPFPIAITNVCDAAAVGLMSARAWGANDTNPYSGTCIKPADYARGDVLVVRRLATNPATVLANDVVYYHSAYEGGEFFTKGTTLSAVRQPPILDYQLEESVYYVSPYTTSPDESPKVPALYRVRLVPGLKMEPELVASGVENLQVRYGVVDPGTSYRYLDADKVAANQWDLVSSIEISLLVRADAKEAGYTATSTYKIGDQQISANDGYRRVVFSTVVQMRN
jgi:type IV pilus assembly protein PilW